ncbi:MAG: hypothetical protein ACLFP2_05020 [Candidatus Woesearchaeota archaeon]
MVVLYDRFNFPDDVFEIIFATKQQIIVGRALIEYMKDNSGELNKSQMSLFATSLHDGELTATVQDGEYKGRTVKLTYNKRQFYDRILTPFKTMGMIDYDMYKKVYTLSDKFNLDMIKIGQMWLEELKKPAKNIFR